MGEGVFAGVRVLEIGRGIAAALAGLLLAENGADVVQLAWGDATDGPRDQPSPPFDPAQDGPAALSQSWEKEDDEGSGPIGAGAPEPVEFRVYHRSTRAVRIASHVGR